MCIVAIRRRNDRVTKHQDSPCVVSQRLRNCSLRCFSPLPHEFTRYLSLRSASAFVQHGCNRREETPTHACSFSGKGKTGMWIFSLLSRMKHKNIAVLHPERWKLAAGISHVPLVLTSKPGLAGQISQQGSLSFCFEKIANEN